jgi:hypothetical protein
MNRLFFPALVGVAVLSLIAVSATAADKKKPSVSVWTDPEKAAAEDPDFSVQGEYVTSAEHKTGPQGLQAVALGAGQFLVGVFSGGLPGAGWNGEAPIYETLERAALTEKLGAGEKWQRSNRESPELGAKAPEGAVILFNGETTDAVSGEVKDGLLWAGGQTKAEFGSFHLHVEFRLPYKPKAPPSSQDRGNSGLYLQNRYETQVLDSFGLVYDREMLGDALPLKSDPKQWCGCFYKFKTADTPMCFPPLTWQTYDIDFTAPQFDAEGNKTANTRITVVHNGVKIHDDVELQKGTGNGGSRPEVPRGPIVFQGHGNPIAYRNVWLLER